MFRRAHLILASVAFLSACSNPPTEGTTNDAAGTAAPASAPAAGGNPAPGGSFAQPVNRIGRFDALEGEAVIIRGPQRIAVTAGYAALPGDQVETTANGKVQLTLTDHSVIAIGPNTKIVVSELLLENRTRSGRLSVLIGQFWMHVTQWKAGESHWDIATPNAVAGVRGTTLWGSTEKDTICSLDGTVEVTSIKAAGLPPATLTAGNCATALSQGKLEPLTPTKDQLKDYLGEVLIPSAPR